MRMGPGAIRRRTRERGDGHGVGMERRRDDGPDQAKCPMRRVSERPTRRDRREELVLQERDGGGRPGPSRIITAASACSVAQAARRERVTTDAVADDADERGPESKGELIDGDGETDERAEALARPLHRENE